MIVDATGKPVGDAPLTEAEAVPLMIAEMQTRDEPLLLGPLNPLEALQLAGLVQLATRHPDMSAEHRMIAAALVDTVRGYFEGCPTILKVLDRGDDPAQDIARE
jgi:hypothetical protein